MTKPAGELFPRSSGVLLHPTSLPGRHGLGDLGSVAYRFVDFLAASRQRVWQVLPLGPTGYGDSPYACFSAFAGNPLLISLDALVEQGYLAVEELADGIDSPASRVDYGPVIGFKMALLKKAFEGFKKTTLVDEKVSFAAFCEEQQDWLDNYALFMAIKQAHGGAAWNAWEPTIALREPAALTHWARSLIDQVQFQKYLQYQFFQQWSRLKRYANERHIRIMGDAPIFVAYDSADVWTNRHLFHLDEQGRSTVVAGVPPDFFSATGQLWGNPLYRWEVLAESGYAWWIKRLRGMLTLVDLIRLDHFRGFEAYWEIPAGAKTARMGRWVPGPGADFFVTVARTLGHLPLVAEDLGLITAPVEALRERFNLPGMKVLQFGFKEDARNPHLPHNFDQNCVVYTGTHDNDTSVGWFDRAGSAERSYLLKYLNSSGGEIHWDLIRLAFASVAHTAIIPLQDLLGLGSAARMNFPGRARGNWSWRYPEGVLTEAIQERLGELTEVYGRSMEKAKRNGVMD